MTAAGVDSDGLMKFLFCPGKNYITDGERGGGKTFHAVAFAELLLRRKSPPWGHVVLLTNIIFLRKTADGLVNDTPDGVYHVTSMRSMLLKIGEILQMHGRDVTILVILDEAQNFMLSDVNADKVNLSLIRWFGTARKFNCVTWLITPAINNLVPRVRNFYNDDKPGYMSGMFRKDTGLARKYIDRHRLQGQPRDYTTIQYGAKGRPWLMHIPRTSWTRSPDELEEGEYCYDHLSSADFSLGDDFDIKEFVQAVSNVPSHLIADAIVNFFRCGAVAKESELQAAEANMRIAQMLRLDRMRRMRFSWSKISDIEDVPETTLKRWYKKHFNDKEEVANG